MGTLAAEIQRSKVIPAVAHLGFSGPDLERCMWLGDLHQSKQSRVSANVTALRALGCTSETLLKLLSNPKKQYLVYLDTGAYAFCFHFMFP